ncbi:MULTISPECIES: hypothetical protein [Pseudomonas]|uniref:hypothetical protein n=1 Tax=Pseudomonas TaxID=286 RepID=UPI00159D7B22|nr:MULTISPECIES: hypothetical protein [Pseudomonas]MBP2273970.1 hypothetical protein [Pseudomonas sp. BP6]MBP2287059.1 hypothetical protein [Pseudomonas sp. BP7]HDS1697233.1 hypothetical protein [Pseudomonas putida]HDS1702352.1 hypothetical protein [Pseudomonas putida]
MDSLIAGVNEKVASMIAGLGWLPQGAGREKYPEDRREGFQGMNGSVPRTVYSWTKDWQ